MPSIYLVPLSLTREVGIFGTWVNHCGDLEVTSEILKVQKKCSNEWPPLDPLIANLFQKFSVIL